MNVTRRSVTCSLHLVHSLVSFVSFVTLWLVSLFIPTPVYGKISCPNCGTVSKILGHHFSAFRLRCQCLEVVYQVFPVTSRLYEKAISSSNLARGFLAELDSEVSTHITNTLILTGSSSNLQNHPNTNEKYTMKSNFVITLQCRLCSWMFSTSYPLYYEYQLCVCSLC